MYIIQVYQFLVQNTLLKNRQIFGLYFPIRIFNTLSISIILSTLNAKATAKKMVMVTIAFRMAYMKYIFFFQLTVIN